jgi:hypothetical protein
MEMATENELIRLAGEAATAKGVALGRLAARILALQTADKFRLAAMLLDVGCPGLSETVGKRACDEIQIAVLLRGHSE